MHQFQKMIFLMMGALLLILSGCAGTSYTKNFPQVADENRPPILEWTTEATTDMNTYTFANHKRNLRLASNYFTPSGWKDFMANANVNKVLNEKLVVTAVPGGSPTILNQGNNTWVVQMPLLITYENASGGIISSQRTMVTMSVMKAAPGAGVKGFIVRQYSAQVR